MTPRLSSLASSVKTNLRLGPIPPRLVPQVLYADRALLVLQKPPGLVCQETKSNAEASVSLGHSLTGALQAIRKEHSLENSLYPVHRLDKGTSGALLVGRTPQAARDISQQLQKRDVGKTYLALVRGGEKTFSSRSGTIRERFSVHDGWVTSELPSAAKDGTKSRRGERDSSDSVAPRTDWELLASSPNVPISLLRLRLHTGHKHQLRVHLASSLHAPILGDTLHSRSALPSSITDHVRVPQQRLFLHASHVELWRFRSTGSSKRYRLGVYAPLPSDFVKLCQSAKIPLDMASPEVAGGLFADGVRAGEETLAHMGGQWLPQPGSRTEDEMTVNGLN